MKNTPYVKEYNKNGEVTNPINGIYKNEFPNRRERRKKERFCGNGKNFHLTILRNEKFKRVRQFEFDKNGNKKIIEHYL